MCRLNNITSTEPELEKWSAVDAWFTALFAPAEDIFERVLAANVEAGLPAHDVSMMQGKMLAFFITLMQAKTILEIGTLGGFSTLWMARALPAEGRITTLEADEQHARVARQNIHNAGLSDRVDLRTGKALEVLPSLSGPFDIIFIDADKKNNPGYLDWALRLSRPGTLIIADNIVRGGAILESQSPDDNVQGIRTFLSRVANHPHLTATALQTVGAKGWDGFALAVVTPAKT